MPTFAEKYALSGTISAYGYDSLSSVRAVPESPVLPVRYAWDAGNACDSAGLGTNYPITPTKVAGQGNTKAYAYNGVCYPPIIDTSFFYIPGGGIGSIRFTMPDGSSSGAGGYFEASITGDVGLSTWPFIGAPSQSAEPGYLGSVLYTQWYQYIQSAMITETTALQTGWKQIIQYGNPPNGSTASNVEVTLVNGNMRGIPTLYGQGGSDAYEVNISGESFNPWLQFSHDGDDYVGICPYNQGYTQPPCIRYIPDQWVEYTVRIMVDPTNSGVPNAANSRATLWMNGRVVLDYLSAKIDWGGAVGDGIGSFSVLNYITDKDPGLSNTESYTWYDDLIFSLNPIPMMGSKLAMTIQ